MGGSVFHILKFLVPVLTSFTINAYTVGNSYEFAENISNIPDAF